MENYFLKVGNSWGLSPKPGKKEMFIGDDGSFLIKITYFLPNTSNENKETNGNIDEERIMAIKKFLEESAQTDYHNTVLDSDNFFEYKTNSKKVTIENDSKLWAKLMRLLPEYKNYN